MTTAVISRTKIFIEQILNPTQGNIGINQTDTAYTLGRQVIAAAGPAPQSFDTWVTQTTTWALGIQDGSITVVG